jgi:hypothetical protein
LLGKAFQHGGELQHTIELAPKLRKFYLLRQRVCGTRLEDLPV